MVFFSWLRPRPSNRARRAQCPPAAARYRPRFESLEDRLCLSDVSFGPAINWAVGDAPESVAVADFNGDGRADLAVANFNSDNVSVLLGNGSGGFAAPVNFAAGDGPRFVAVGEFNGDSRPDLAVVNRDSDNVTVLLGDGSGNFGSAPLVAVGDFPFSVAVGDFNNDGRADLAVANVADDNVSVLLGNGSGGFAAPVNIAAGDGPGSLAVGDFNNDGRPDLAVANFNSDNVSVLLGDGSGNFGSAPLVAVGDFPISVAVGDFNNDGRADLAVANVFSDNVSVLLGDGSGEFAAPVNFAVGNGPASVVVADFNNDGRADLAVAITSSDNVSVLLGNGSGGFAAPVNFAAGVEPRFVAVGDFNNDGRADLATVNLFSDDVSVLLNTTPPNQPPVVGNQTFAVNENSADGTAVGTVAASDPDAGQSLSYQITAGNAAGAFALNASTGQITVGNGMALDFEASPVFTLIVQVTDNGTPALSSTATITINLNNANEAPVNSVPTGSQSVANRKSLTFSHANGNALAIVDPDASTAVIEVSLSVLHGTLTLAGTAGLTFHVGDGTSDGSLTFRGTIAAINAALDGLTYKPAKGYTGGDSLTITASDLGSGIGDPLLDADVVAILVKGKK